jgi:hypothetical protein
MSGMTIEEQMEQLEKEFSFTDDFERKLEIKDKIHNLKLLLSGAKPTGSSEIECVGCGS